MKTASEIRARMPAARQAKIAARTQALLAEEMTLRDLRKAQKLTQEQMAVVLKIRRDLLNDLQRIITAPVQNHDELKLAFIVVPEISAILAQHGLDPRLSMSASASVIHSLS